MMQINDVKAPSEVRAGTEFTLTILYDSASSASARIAVEPPQEIEIAPERALLPPAPLGGGTADVKVTIRRKAESTTREARILVTGGTTASTFTRLT